MPKIIAGIDPGVKTGLALWDREKRKLEAVNTVSIIEAQDILRIFHRTYGLHEIWFEDARQRGGKPDPNILQGVGSVKRDSAIWQEFCEYYKIPYQALKPDESLTKWSSQYFKQVTGWKGRASQHARDAAALVYGV